MKTKREVFGHEVFQQRGKWFVQISNRNFDGPFKSFNQAYSEYRRRIKKK